MNIKNAKEEDFRALFASCYDVKIEKRGGALVIHCKGMADTKQLNENVLPRITEMMQNEELKLLDESVELNQIEQSVFSGNVIILHVHENRSKVYEADISNPPKRQPEESTSEVSIRGSRDGFTEEVITNVALIRKRLKTASLQYEHCIVGKRGNVRLAILYIKDIINPEYVAEAKRRIAEIDVDTVIGSAQLEEYLSDSSDSIFPLVDYIGRPDFAVEVLLHGRFIILADGSPMAIIGPSNIIEQLKSPEDVHSPYYYTILQRFLRFVGLVAAMFLPGFYISLTCFNIDQLPFPLLASIAVARTGIPYPAPLEILLMFGLFELFREAGVRLPKAVGQTVTVVGGLIIGDAAIRSGLASPSMLMVTAATAVASFTLVNQSLTGTVTIVRIYMLLISSLLGMYGFFIGLISVVGYTSTLTSFGISYWSPMAELDIRSSILAIFNQPFKSKNKRPNMLHTIDSKSQGERQ
ncbi:spore germination protein [Paenibacillus allorhizosphaerae]|uniref:Spore germination protein XA n=1 Tax=Paenibacillus allorhizosphaerae TaxID=2849866 RepID=A0ABN7TJK5_9BACL|nr:spore germination protein [Paenibacillus allorhizosphaerae]CAG7638908.1 Spore germination protein XA [Paenibacillus allorhizosphaerae]